MGSITKDITGQILKTDEEQRMVYGWASVVTEKGEPVIDRQGDIIEPDTLVRAVNKFMEHVRVGLSRLKYITMKSGPRSSLVN